MVSNEGMYMWPEHWYSVSGVLHRSNIICIWYVRRVLNWITVFIFKLIWYNCSCRISCIWCMMWTGWGTRQIGIKTTQWLPVGKEYLCFQVNIKSPHAAQCVKSRVLILNKAIDSILSINTFEQQCVVIQYMLLKYANG